LRKSQIGISLIQDVGQYSKVDNLPTKVYEYMGAGLPVITSDFPYMKSIIEKYECGICVKTNDLNAVADAVKYLQNNAEMAKKWAKMVRN